MTQRKSEPVLISSTGMVEELNKMVEEVRASLARHKVEYYEKLGFQPTSVNCTSHPGQICEFDEEASLAHYYSTKKVDVLFFPCPVCQNESLVDEKNYKWRKIGVPKKVQTATFKNYNITTAEQEKAHQLVFKQALTKKGFIIMLGKNGCGKSHLAAATLKICGDGIFIIEDDLVTELRRTYDEGGKEKMLRKFKETPCLVIDDIDAQLKGDDINPLLFNILNYRYDRDLITVLTTNETLDTLQDILGNRIRDRIASDYVVANFTWDSYRRKSAAPSNTAGNT